MPSKCLLTPNTQLHSTPTGARHSSNIHLRGGPSPINGGGDPEPCTVYPVRCAHILPPCHFSVCFDLLVVLTSRVLFCTSKVIIFSIIFEARAIILESRGPIWTISGMVVSPQRHTVTRFLQSYGFFFVCLVLYVVNFCDS